MNFMPTFAAPTLLYSLIVAVPALLAIYWLRQRARERQVSSLLLWRGEREVWDGGRRWERLQLPWLFWLELLVVLALFGAAARPLLRAGASARPLVVVLDDSFSMLAGDGATAQTRARQAITRELQQQTYAPVQFVLAGAKPQLLGNATTLAEAAALLERWQGGAASANLEEAITFGFALGGKRARVLVVTDHAPANGGSENRLQWWAFGQAQANLAFINAARSARGDSELILLEVANLATERRTATLSLENAAAQTLDLAPGASQRLSFKRPASAAPLRASLSADALAADNNVVLLPETARRIRVSLRLSDAELRPLVERALQAAPNVTLTEAQSDLIVSETEIADAGAATWTLQLVKEANAASYLGPFVVDHAHPLTEGLAFGGVVWAAGASTQLAGRPLITAGNVPLLTDVERDNGRHELRLRWQPALSTLQLSPNWPILWWNLANWRASVATGLREQNIRLGSVAELQTNAALVTVTPPNRAPLQLPVSQGRGQIPADAPGLYQIRDGANQWQFAVNALQKSESDLTGHASGRWGNWANATEFEWDYRNCAWVLLLVALLSLVAHSWLTHRPTQQAAPVKTAR